jgi:hypothetical protein
MKTNLLWLCCLASSACNLSGVFPSGSVTTTTREVSAFRRVSVSSAITLNGSPGARSVTVRANENLQDVIEAVVVGDTLTLRLKDQTVINGNATMVATVSNDVFEGVSAAGAATVTVPATGATNFPIDVSGASTVEVTGLSSTSVSVNVGGASTVTVSGAATSGTFRAEGASTVRAKGLPLTSLQVTVTGASTVVGNVSGTLTGEATGASTVTITGTPTNTVSSTGASTVTLGAP